MRLVLFLIAAVCFGWSAGMYVRKHFPNQSPAIETAVAPKTEAQERRAVIKRGLGMASGSSTMILLPGCGEPWGNYK
jgi:hypothetical protein